MIPSRRSIPAVHLPAILILVLILLATAGCDLGKPSPAEVSTEASMERVPTADAEATPIKNTLSTLPATPTSTATALPSLTPTKAAAPITPTTPPTPTPCTLDVCTYANTFLFSRPIGSQGNDSVDGSYRFGSTQGGKRDPHHGVEFLNGYGTPVLAARDGVVVVAGDDRETLYAPYPNFYGNLVIIEHRVPDDVYRTVPDMPSRVYTLYAHLSEILVEEGDEVKTGDEIGAVGMGGAATGSHLHFEVRLEESNYASSRNPELWIKSRIDDDGQMRGAIAGRILDDDGNMLIIAGIVLQHLPDGPSQPSDWENYTNSYEESAIVGQPPWGENFAFCDLPAGWYRISFPYYGLRQHLIKVLPGQISVVTIQISGQ